MQTLQHNGIRRKCTKICYWLGAGAWPQINLDSSLQSSHWSLTLTLGKSQYDIAVPPDLHIRDYRNKCLSYWLIMRSRWRDAHRHLALRRPTEVPAAAGQIFTEAKSRARGLKQCGAPEKACQWEDWSRNRGKIILHKHTIKRHIEFSCA